MGKIAKFTNAYLETFVKEHGLELRKDYTDIFVDSKTVIEAKCILCVNDMVPKQFYGLDQNKILVVKHVQILLNRQGLLKRI